MPNVWGKYWNKEGGGGVNYLNIDEFFLGADEISKVIARKQCIIYEI